MVLAQFSVQAPGSWLLFSLITSMLLFSLKHYLPTDWQTWLTVTFWLLIPYLGLLLGGLSPRLIGLSNIDWLASLGLGSGIIFVVLLLLILVRATTESSRTDAPIALSHQATTMVMPTPSAERTALTTQLYQIVQSGAEEFHWCFLRGALWEFIQMLPTPPSLPAYWAVWTAAILITPEALLRQENGAQRLFLLLILLATTILFLYTRNFWLCWMLHTTAKFIANPHYAQRAAVGVATAK